MSCTARPVRVPTRARGRAKSFVERQPDRRLEQGRGAVQWRRRNLQNPKRKEKTTKVKGKSMQVAIYIGKNHNIQDEVGRS